MVSLDVTDVIELDLIVIELGLLESSIVQLTLVLEHRLGLVKDPMNS